MYVRRERTVTRTSGGNVSLSKAVKSSDSQYYENNAVQLGIRKRISTVVRVGRKQRGKASCNNV
jgi:hypothetical protein